MKKTIGFILLLFMLFVDGMNAQTKDNYPANYARAPRFKALIYLAMRNLWTELRICY